MKPDEKYMPRDNRDLNFIPLNLKGPFNPKENGWMPIIDTENSIATIVSANNSTGIFTPSSVLKPTNFNNQNTTLPTGTNNGMIPNPNLFPSEDVANELFSYNKKSRSNDEKELNINIEEILREINFDFNDFTDIDNYRACCNTKINEIFKCIQNGHPAIISTFKAYRLPEPVANILIKKIISVSLEHCDKE